MIPGLSEMLIIFGVALLLFGPSKLPQLGSAIGESIRNFRKGMKPVDEPPPPPLTQQQQQVLLTQQTQQVSEAPHVIVEQKSDPKS